MDMERQSKYPEQKGEKRRFIPPAPKKEEDVS